MGSENNVIVLEGDHLSLVGHELASVPESLGQQYGPQVKTLDLSYNSISKLQNLEKFINLTALIADNNQIDSDQSFPSLEKLKTLSLNNNNIVDLRQFVDSLSDKFPQLTHLSMIKNPACPNEMTGRDTDDYKRYRLYVLYKLKNLRFLDSSIVNEDEKKEAQRVGHLSLPARPDPSQYRKSIIASTSPEEETFNQLPQDLKQEGVGKASFGVSNYVYYGRQSEGNRFIVNEDLWAGWYRA